MRTFRFPRLAIFFMVATFLTILAAISLATEMARTVSADHEALNLPALWWSELPGVFVRGFLLFWGFGAVGYAVLWGLRRTGSQRFPKIETWPARRQ